jgi:geranylgeranyl reductase family protein
MSNTYDIIIVGAGPAGTTAAHYASKNGLKVLMLDKDVFPRDKVCGDALSGKSIGILRDMNLLEEVQNLPGAFIQSIVFSSPNHDHFRIDLRNTSLKNIPKGFVIRRQIFDNFLFEKIKATDVEIRENFSVTDVLQTDGFVTGVRGKDRKTGEILEFNSKLLFGADGYNSIVSRKMDLYEHDPDHWVVALRCYYKNVGGLTDQIELHYVDEVIPGYFWIFPIEDGYANIGIGMLHSIIKRKDIDLKKALKNAINSPTFRDRFVDAEPQEKPIGWNLPVGSKRRKSYGNGFLLLGDAAGLIDPFTGEGIGNAMYSGKFAIETAVEALNQIDYSADFLAQYEDNLWDMIGNELNISSKLQKMGQNKFLLNFVIGKAAKNPEVSDIIAGMLANEVPRKRLANPLFYAKLLFS